MPPTAEIEVFATGVSVLVTHGELPPDATPAGASGHRRDFHARRGPRPGASPTPITGTRRGGTDDIVRPVLMHPARAAELATDGTLFGEPVPHLVVEHRTEPGPLMWTARVDHGRRRPRTAILQLLGSPSMVVTVIELVPTRRLRFGRDRYLAEGIAAVEELAHRLERAGHPTAGARRSSTTTPTPNRR